MAVALGKSCNSVFCAQIYSQNSEAGYIHPTGDKYFRLLYLIVRHFIVFNNGQLRILGLLYRIAD